MKCISCHHPAALKWRGNPYCLACARAEYRREKNNIKTDCELCHNNAAEQLTGMFAEAYLEGIG